MIRNEVITISSKSGTITYVDTKNLGLQKIQHKLKLKRIIYNQFIVAYCPGMDFSRSEIITDNRKTFSEWVKHFKTK